MNPSKNPNFDPLEAALRSHPDSVEPPDATECAYMGGLLSPQEAAEFERSLQEDDPDHLADLQAQRAEMKPMLGAARLDVLDDRFKRERDAFFADRGVKARVSEPESRRRPVRARDWGSWVPTAIAACFLVLGSILFIESRKKDDDLGGSPPPPTFAWVPRDGPLASFPADKFFQLDQPGRRVAGLVAAVGGYSHWGDPSLRNLPFTSEEADEACDVLERFCGAPPQNILKLYNSGKDKRTPPDREFATEAAVRAAVLCLKQQFDQPRDLIIIHIASHGVVQHGELRFLLADSRPGEGLRASDLLEPLKDSPGHVLLVAHVCHAGQIVEKPNGVGPRHWIVAAASAGQKALGTAFSDEWFAALRGKADTNGDGCVSLEEAFEWTQKTLREKHSEQILALRAPRDPALLPLALQRDLRLKLPARGDPAPAPALATVLPGASGAVNVWIDGRPAGSIAGKSGAKLYVAPGEHTFGARWAALDFSADPFVSDGSRFDTTIEFKSGEVHEFLALKSVAPLSRLRVIPLGPKADAPFKKLVLSPPESKAIKAEWKSEGMWQFDASWDGSAGVAPVLSALFRSTLPEGEDIQGMFGLQGEKAELVLSFSARCDAGAVPVTFFLGGGGDLDAPRKVNTVTLQADGWQPVTIHAPAADLQRLVTGFGIEVSREANGGRGVTFFVRDVTLAPAAP